MAKRKELPPDEERDIMRKVIVEQRQEIIRLAESLAEHGKMLNALSIFARSQMENLENYRSEHLKYAKSFIDHIKNHESPSGRYLWDQEVGWQGRGDDWRGGE